MWPHGSLLCPGDRPAEGVEGWLLRRQVALRQARGLPGRGGQLRKTLRLSSYKSGASSLCLLALALQVRAVHTVGERLQKEQGDGQQLFQ